MRDKKLLVLGCVPALLNVLFELANESLEFAKFHVIKNIPVDIENFYKEDLSFDVIYSMLNELKISDIDSYKFAFSVVGTTTKEVVFNQFREILKIEKEMFPNLIHPTSYISKSVSLNQGLQIEPLSIVSSCTKIGFGVTIKRGSNIGHHCHLEDYVTINPGVVISSFVNIGEKTMIGSGATIKDNINIGKNTLIGAGSVVVKDIPDNCIAYGNPCKVKRMLVI